ncbi:MAG: redoxin domain-containing protein [Burkholderiales bacterium]|nr:redoxin domain-containing protein [Burkholderiales bacterium]
MTSHLESRESAYREAMVGGRIKMLLLLLVCAAPVIASYVTFYFIRPSGGVNYGTLITPVRPLPELALTRLDGTAFPLAELRGKWVLLTFDAGACAPGCPEKLHKMRQLRTMQGKERERIERAWLITDGAPLATLLIREYDGTRMLRATDPAVARAFPAAERLTDHIYLIDPLGNLVLRYPKDADPMKMHKDLGRLLKYSGIG